MIRTIQNTMKNLWLRFNQKLVFVNAYSNGIALNSNYMSKGMFFSIIPFAINEINKTVEALTKYTRLLPR